MVPFGGLSGTVPELGDVRFYLMLTFSELFYETRKDLA
jgi:hypothetical protein